MTIRLVAAVAATVWILAMTTSKAMAGVDLELRPRVPVAGSDVHVVGSGVYLDIDLYAVFDGVGDDEFSTVDVVLTWDPAALRLRGPAIRSSAYNWNFKFGFEWDELADGLNADCGADSYCSPFSKHPFNDGDAYFQALSSSSTYARATGQGLLIATLPFMTVGDVLLTSLVIEPALGNWSTTRVLLPPGVDVTGQLGEVSVTVRTDAYLSVADLSIVAGREVRAIASGRIDGVEVVGVEAMLEVIPRVGATGTVLFTSALDVTPLDDPWLGVGTFESWDVDVTTSSALNGMGKDNGTFQPAAVTFSGDLVSCPMVASSDAVGVWDVALSTSVGVGSWQAESGSGFMQSVPTGLTHGVLRVVELGDGDGSGVVDLRDFSELQACLTKDLGPVDPPAFAWEPALRCGVYDFDDDGDVDVGDYGAFEQALQVPAP